MSFSSNESTDYHITSETLDKVYFKQMQTLNELILRADRPIIELCRKWIKIFSKTTEREKVARNCLCSLMYEQMVEHGFLGEPFINLQNCNRDLEHILIEMDEQSRASDTPRSLFMSPRICSNFNNYQQPSTTSIHNFQANHETIPRANVSNRFNEHAESAQAFWPGNKAIFPNEVRNEFIHGNGDACAVDELSRECEKNEKHAENTALRNELQMLRLQLTEKEIEISHLKENAENYQVGKNNNESENVKEVIVKSIEIGMHNLNKDEKQEFPIKIFESIFSDFKSDQKFLNNIRTFDNDFQQLLGKHFEAEYNKRKKELERKVSSDYNETKNRLRTKYHRRLRMQDWAQKLQLKLVKLKCFSVLRHLFINMQSSKRGVTEDMWEMLRVLEEKYESIVNEIL